MVEKQEKLTEEQFVNKIAVTLIVLGTIMTTASILSIYFTEAYSAIYIMPLYVLSIVIGILTLRDKVELEQ